MFLYKSYQMYCKGHDQKEEPYVEVKGICQNILVGVVEPASSQGGPNPLTENI